MVMTCAQLKEALRPYDIECLDYKVKVYIKMLSFWKYVSQSREELIVPGSLNSLYMQEKLH